MQTMQNNNSLDTSLGELAEKQKEAAIFYMANINFSYSEIGKTILQNVNFALFPGQTIGLWGNNGTGKTTFFRCITGLVKPDSGSVFFRNMPMRSEKDFHRLRCNVGFVLQNSEDQLFFPTVLEDVSFGPLNLGLSADAARERARESLDLAGLADFESRLCHQLSGGEKKLVALAGILAMRPAALLLDEPMAGLDENMEKRVEHIINNLPCAKIIVSHDRDYLQRNCMDIMTIKNGQLIPASFPPGK